MAWHRSLAESCSQDAGSDFYSVRPQYGSRIFALRPDVRWKDLLALSRREVVTEVLLSLPWLVASLAAAAASWQPVALPFSFMFFLTGLRQVHGAFHYSLGLRRGPTDALLAFMSLAMLGSMHAVQFNHLRHHAHCLDDHDVEAMSAKMPAWKALVTGPWFPVRLHAAAWRLGTPRVRRWMVVELGLTGFVVVIALGSDITWLRYHVWAMLAAQCLTSFFAVWTVHHDCSEDAFARTIRGALKGAVTYDMFYHLEHHLFPAVPTRRLPELARRLDTVAPELARHRVF